MSKPRTAGMQLRMMLRFIVDCSMAVLLLLLMSFELLGRDAHEWIGLAMFFLFLIHHGLNWKWSTHIFRGSYTPVRSLMTLSAGAVFLTMFGSVFSAVLISREVFAFLPIDGGNHLGRSLHMLSAYWGFVLMSFHLGLHWDKVIFRMKKIFKNKVHISEAALKLISGFIFLYGAVAFVRRELPDYLFLKSQYVFFNFEEPIFFFLLDYLAIMGMFICLGHYSVKCIRVRRTNEG